MCLIDFEKSFDTVWTEGSIYKLIKKGFPTHLMKIIWNMITKRNFSVYDTSGEASIKFEVKNGLQQGTVNSPILFNIFNSNIVTY